MLKIYYGRENTDKDKFIFSRTSGRTILLVPDQFTLQAERNAFKYLGVKGLMDLEVMSPSRLGLWVLKEVGGEKAVRLDKFGRHMLLSKILSQQKDDDRVFKGMTGKASFIELVNNLLSEMKQYNVPPEALPEIMESLEEDTILYKKLKYIENIYEEYERVIADKYIDTEDYLQHCIDKIKKSKRIRNCEIWVYGFDYFTPKNLNLIRELIDNAINVNVVMTYGKGAGDDEIFSITGNIIEKLEKISEALSKPYTTKQIPKEYLIRKGEAPELEVVESQLFALPSKKWEVSDAHADMNDINSENQQAEAEQRTAEQQTAEQQTAEQPTTESRKSSRKIPSITLVRAANPYAEIETAAAYITKLLREEKLRYKDIAVICNDLENRGSIIQRVFDEYGIMPFMDRKRSILHNPVISLNIYLMQLARGRMDRETVIGFIKTGFSGISEDAAEKLGNYAYKYKVRGNMWKKEFTRGREEYPSEELEEINRARCFLMETILSFTEPFQKAATAGEKIAVLYYFLKDNLQLPYKLEELIEQQNRKGYYESAFEMAQIWKIAVEIYDQMVTVMGEEELKTEELDEILRAGFEAVEIGMLPATIDELIVGTMQRTRTGQIKALVVIGANDGLLPSSPKGGGLLNDDEKAALFKKNIEICRLDDLRVMEEKIGIYRAMSKPEKYLFMSHSISDNDGRELKPSVIFNKMTAIFPKLKVEEDIINCGRPGELLGSIYGGVRHLTGALRGAAEGEPLEDCWKAAINWYRIHENEVLQQVGRGIFYRADREKMSEKQASELYKREENNSLSLSPSRLEKFGRCPFAHFVNYGLKPDEKRVFEVAGREIGDIYHLCMMKLSEHLTDRGIPITDKNSRWMNITQKECAEFISSCVDSQRESYREGVLALGHEEDYKAGRIKRVCTDAAMILVEHVQQGKIQEVHFESEFGRASGKDFPPVEVETAQGRVLIEGKIDRVDILPGDSEKYVKIIDYKSGNEKFDIEEVKGGWRLQLMLYLKAALGAPKSKEDYSEGKTKPAGVFYFKLEEPLINAGTMDSSRLAEKVKAEVRRTFKLDGILVDDPQVIESIAGEFEGSSDILPVRKNKDGQVVESGKNKLLSNEDFEELQKAVDKKVTELCEELYSGDTQALPARTQKETACKYCTYKSICKFDLAFEGCRYRDMM